MTDSSDIEIEKLVWPTLFHDFNEPKETIEHIELKEDLDSIEDVLFEIEIRHPHISKKLRLLIGYSEFEIELNNLLIDKRENRQGFDKHIFKNLFNLYNLHIKKYGILTTVNLDNWELNRSR